MSIRKDISGNKYGMLTAMHAYLKKGKHICWLFKCDCGKHKYIYKFSVVNNHQRDCGCVKSENSRKRILNINKTHGMTGTRFHNIWFGIKNRCYNKNNNRYHIYGDRGIKVCDSWLQFENFKNDMYSSYTEKTMDTPNCQIDRIDNDKGYSKDNCRWTSPLENSLNKRSCKNKRKFNKQQIVDIRRLYNNGNSVVLISKKYKVNSKTIYSIVNYKTYKDIE